MHYSFLYPPAWYWINPDTQEVYSTPAGAIVTTSDPEYMAFIADKNTAGIWPTGGGEMTQASMAAWLISQGLPTTGLTLSAPQLLVLANNKVNQLLSISRAYINIGGNGGPSVNCDGGMQLVNGVYSPTSTPSDLLGLVVSPPVANLAWSDNSGNVIELTPTQCAALAMAVKVYIASVWACMNGTVLPAIANSTITTAAQLNAQTWPT
jgi:hypothetical protein